MTRAITSGGLWMALVAGLALATVGAFAQSDEASRRATSIARTTASPFCPGKTLDACPSPAAGEWRRDIRTWVDQGLETEEIRTRLQARVPNMDLSGKPMGDDSWLLPVLAMGLVTVGFALWMLRLWRRPRGRSKQGPSGDEADGPDGGFDERLDEELARLDG